MNSKIDKYQHMVKVNDCEIYYDTLTGDIVFFNTLNPDISPFLRDETARETRLASMRINPEKIIRRTQLYLVLTQKCNLACRYCRQSQNFCSSENMSVSMALEAINTMQSKAEGLESIVFYGGEPLLNYEVFFAVVDYIRQSCGNRVSISIITNGLLVTDEIAAYMKRNEVFCILSLDGFTEAHNQYRVKRNGCTAYGDIMKALQRLIAAGLKVGISCTVGPHNINDLGAFAKWTAAHQGLGNVFFALPHFEESGLLSSDITDKMWRNNFVETFQLAGQFVENLARIMNGILLGSYKRNTCPACGGRVVVRPDGKFGICTGSLVEKDIYYRNTLEEQAQIALYWAEASTPVNDPRCHSCIAFRVCGGGCPYDTRCYTGSFTEKEGRRCIITRNIVEASLKWMADRVKEKSSNQAMLVLDVQLRKDLQDAFQSHWFTPLRSSSEFGLR